MDDPGDLSAVLRLEQQHVAVVARGDELVLEQAIGVARAQEGFHDRGELRAEPGESAACLLELRRRVVGDLARGEERPADDRGDGRDVADARSEAGEAGSVLRFPHPPADLDAALDERRHVEEHARLEVVALHPGRGEGLGEIGKVVVRLPAGSAQECNAFARPREGLLDLARPGGRLEALQAVAAGGRARLHQEQGPDLVELQGPETMAVQRGSSSSPRIQPAASQTASRRPHSTGRLEKGTGSQNMKPLSV